MSTKKLLFLLFFTAFFIRLATLVGILYYYPNEQFKETLRSLDAETYNIEGRNIARYWHGISKNKDKVFSHYSYFNAIVFYLFGFHPIVPQVINCFLGAITVIFIYLVAKVIFDQKIAILSSVFYSFFPSLVFWSTKNLKEASYLFSVVVIIWFVIKLQQGHKKINVAYYLLSTILLLYLRFMKIHIFLFLSYAIITSFIINIERKMIYQRIFNTLFFIIVVSIIGGSFLNYRFIPRPSLIIKDSAMERSEDSEIDRTEISSRISAGTHRQNNFNEMRKLSASFCRKISFIFAAIDRSRKNSSKVGDSVFMPETDISTPIKALKFLPFGMIHFLFAPFPWKAEGFLQKITIPEMLLWYSMIPFILYGLFYSIRFELKKIFCIFFYITMTTLLYSLALPNIGTIYRIRASIFPFCFMFASVGIIHFSHYICKRSESMRRKACDRG